VRKQPRIAGECAQQIIYAEIKMDITCHKKKTLNKKFKGIQYCNPEHYNKTPSLYQCKPVLTGCDMEANWSLRIRKALCSWGWGLVEWLERCASIPMITRSNPSGGSELTFRSDLL
jgi:hypothetical protein